MLNGIINIYKEKGYTSHDVVAKLRGILGQKKIGHTGTLDPDAEGVLPVCLGKATKVCDLLTDRDKTYHAVLLLGKTTDTQDISGAVLEEKDPSGLGESEVTAMIREFEGSYEQIPPMYSALKVNGKKLYELAREGITVERKPRTVTIREIRILQVDLPRVWLEVTCSKGTYIRTLCHDIGERLGVGGCMEQLTRTRVGEFRIEDSIRLDEVRRQSEEGRAEQLLLPIDRVFMSYRSICVGEDADLRLKNGNPLPGSVAKIAVCDKERCRVYDSSGTFSAVYSYEEQEDLYRVVKMFL